MSQMTIDALKYMIKKEILEHYKNLEKSTLIEKLCDEHLKNIKFDMNYNDYKKQRAFYDRSIYQTKNINNCLCHARIWNDHRGGRCSNKIKVNDQIEYEIEKQLCQRHCKIIKKNKGELYFGKYTDPLPLKPIWNQEKKCPLGKSLNWYCSK